MCYIGAADGRIKKEGKWGLASLFHVQSTLSLLEGVHKILKHWLAEGSATEIFIGEKDNWINKGTDKKYVAVLLVHSTTNHYQALYQISES